MPCNTVEATPLPTRMVLLSGLLVSLGLVVETALAYRGFVSLSGAKQNVTAAVLLLLLYCAAIAWPDKRRVALFRPGFATQAGAIAGVIQVVHLLIERFAHFAGEWDGITTLAFMLATFLVWARVGFRARRGGASMIVSSVAAVWSAMVTMAMVVPCGMALEWFVAPVPLEWMRNWPEFQRSGWTDLAAFSIANTIDSISTHLWMGPVFAILFGAVGAATGRVKRSSIVDPGTCDELR